jgi:hypothetical protein
MIGDFDFEGQWQAKLVQGLEINVGEAKRKEVMRGCEKLSDGSDRMDVVRWTVEAMERLDPLIDNEQRHDIFTACTCRYPTAKLENLRKKYSETKNTVLVHGLLQQQFLEEIRAYKNLNNTHMEFILQNNMGMAGVIENDVITAVKIPAKFHEYLQTKDPREKKYFYCHCPRVRAALKEEAGLSSNYCYCGAGYYRGIWEYILQKPVKVEVLESLFKGDEVCRIAVWI